MSDRKKAVWLINHAERLHFDKKNSRVMRMGLLAKHLTELGHNVTYITSSFNHVEKTHAPTETESEIRDGLKLIRLKALGYRKHVSVRRLLDHAFVGYQFWRWLKGKQSPDLIVVSYPTLELALVATKFACATKTPIIVDVRDLWPDIFYEIAPKVIRPLIRFLTRPYNKIAQFVLQNADYVTSITPGILEWAESKAGGLRQRSRVHIPFCHPSLSASSPSPSTNVETILSKINYDKDRDFVVTFVGSLARSLDLRPIIEAAGRLEDSNSHIKFLFLGEGDMRSIYEDKAIGLTNVFFPGWVDHLDVRSVLERSHVAINPLPDRFDFLHTFNNKFSEYLAHGLPVLVSPKHSACANFVHEHDCGWSFDLRDPSEFVNILLELSHHLPSNLSIRSKCKKVFEEYFSSEQVLYRWDDIILSVANLSDKTELKQKNGRRLIQARLGSPR